MHDVFEESNTLNFDQHFVLYGVINAANEASLLYGLYTISFSPHVIYSLLVVGIDIRYGQPQRTKVV